jgi:AcrR family transcriptional regulator
MPSGVREQKKQATREQIAEAARGLFKERGFDAVTVDEVARAAGVSRKTVFNYFATKEDLLYSGLELMEERMLAAVRDREPGTPLLDAFADFLQGLRGLLQSDEPGAGERLYEINRLIADSPALQRREEQVYAGYSIALAELVARDTGADPRDVAPRVAAGALVGLQRVLSAYVRERVLEGEIDRSRLARDVSKRTEEGIELLRAGLGHLGAE